jgi:hypothetical protein
MIGEIKKCTIYGIHGMGVRKLVKDARIVTCILWIRKMAEMEQIFIAQKQGLDTHFKRTKQEIIRLKAEK